ncbi:hypothetical protein [Bradyrhizobium sp. JR3.5]
MSIIFGTHALALADQAVVSGTSLMSTVLVGRFTQPSQLGIYAIGLSVLGFVLAVQDALILMPYTIQRHRSSRTPAQHAGLSLLHSVWLSAAAIVVLAIVAVAMIALWAANDLTWLVCTLVLTVPFALQREFNRTYAFAHLNVANALILDAGVAAVQLPVLAWLGLDRQDVRCQCLPRPGGRLRVDQPRLALPGTTEFLVSHGPRAAGDRGELATWQMAVCRTDHGHDPELRQLLGAAAVGQLGGNRRFRSLQQYRVCGQPVAERIPQHADAALGPCFQGGGSRETAPSSVA